MLRSFWHGRVISDSDLAPLGDLTGLEASATHLHVENYLDTGPAAQTLTRPAVLRIGMAYAIRGLESAWRNHRRQCVAIVSAGRPADGVTVRFHVRRDGSSWVTEDLEAYMLEGVAVLEARG
jgi:hypothetical protein